MRFLLPITLVFALGCSKKVSVDDLKKLKEEACACKDKKCAAAINKKLEDKVGDATESDLGKEGMSVAMDIAMCLAKAEAGFYDIGK
jgi:hypothetical protein